MTNVECRAYLGATSEVNCLCEDCAYHIDDLLVSSIAKENQSGKFVLRRNCVSPTSKLGFKILPYANANGRNTMECPDHKNK